ncbi:MAG: hypothetical protein FWG40_08210 [Peptococcaceae bacterium]|nr:hypothetical protein [Peptococcaceae bacterium]
MLLIDERYAESLNKDFEPIRITDESREIVEDYARKCRGSVRFATGRFYTDDEYKEWRQSVLGRD